MSIVRARETAARAIVRWASRWVDRSYAAYCAGRPRTQAVWSRGGLGAEWIAFPLARGIDREAMGDQMAQEGWWG